MLELMIAMALGLLIIAAATGVFLAGQRSLATQTGVGDLQQNAIFGLAQLTHDLRHTNLNTTDSTTIRKETAGSGIVFDAKNKINGITYIADSSYANGTITTSAASTVFRGLRNDQLTIQFRPHQVGILQSCIGTALKANEVNVQRYFIQPMPQGDNRFGLYCEADNETDDFGTRRLIIPDVEAFKVRFGTKKRIPNPPDPNEPIAMRYKGIDQLDNSDEIISVEVGLILRSTRNVGSSNSLINKGASYLIAGQSVQLIDQTPSSPNFVREAFSQVVAIRNSSGSNQ